MLKIELARAGPSEARVSASENNNDKHLRWRTELYYWLFINHVDKTDLSNLDYTQFYWEGLRSNLFEKGFLESMLTCVHTPYAIVQIVLNATYLQRI